MIREQVANTKKYICANAMVCLVAGKVIKTKEAPYQKTHPAGSSLFGLILIMIKQRLNNVTHMRKEIGHLN